MLVTIPAGVAPGMQLQVQAPTGQTMIVTVPQGVGPGMQIQVAMPAPVPAPVPTVAASTGQRVIYQQTVHHGGHGGHGMYNAAMHGGHYKNKGYKNKGYKNKGYKYKNKMKVSTL